MVSEPLAFERNFHDDVTKDDENETILSSQDHNNSLRQLYTGDLYLIGLLWIAALKTVLLGPIPTIEAAAAATPEKKEEKPNKPPKMRYKDLPLYGTQPYSEFSESNARKLSCPEANVKLLHNYILPTVKHYRESIQESVQQARQQMADGSNSLSNEIDRKMADFLVCMRCDGNYRIRYGILALTTLIGFRQGGGGGIPKRIFFTSLGALAGGALCFPDETDFYFKKVAYNVGSVGVFVYNKFCGKNARLPTKVPCHKDHPHQE